MHHCLGCWYEQIILPRRSQITGARNICWVIAVISFDCFIQARASPFPRSKKSDKKKKKRQKEKDHEVIQARAVQSPTCGLK
jgi:hypothetical protein